jgi:hypothetical protein
MNAGSDVLINESRIYNTSPYAYGGGANTDRDSNKFDMCWG